MNDYDSQAKLFKALNHPVRLAILDVLRDGEACVCHLEAALGYRQAYISQQLMALRDTGLVQDRRDGWNVFYHVAKPDVFMVMDAARGLFGRARPMYTIKMPNCPCPHCQSSAESAAC